MASDDGVTFYVLVTFLNIVQFVDFIRANNRSERYFDCDCRNLAVNKVNLGLSGPDGKGFMWCYSRDSKFRRHVGFGTGKCFHSDHQKRPQLPFYFSLLLISGDILSNPGPFEVDMFKDFREQMNGPGIKLCHINVRGLLSKLTEVYLKDRRICSETLR